MLLKQVNILNKNIPLQKQYPQHLETMKVISISKIIFPQAWRVNNTNCNKIITFKMTFNISIKINNYRIIAIIITLNSLIQIIKISLVVRVNKTII